jgi:hypothetical protein
MRTRYKIAAVTLPLIIISVGLWRGLAVHGPADDQIDCNARDPVSSCAIQPQYGIPAGELVVLEPELASAGTKVSRRQQSLGDRGSQERRDV